MLGFDVRRSRLRRTLAGLSAMAFLMATLVLVASPQASAAELGEYGFNARVSGQCADGWTSEGYDPVNDVSLCRAPGMVDVPYNSALCAEIAAAGPAAFAPEVLAADFGIGGAFDLGVFGWSPGVCAAWGFIAGPVGGCAGLVETFLNGLRACVAVVQQRATGGIVPHLTTICVDNDLVFEHATDLNVGDTFIVDGAHYQIAAGETCGFNCHWGFDMNCDDRLGDFCPVETRHTVKGLHDCLGLSSEAS